NLWPSVDNIFNRPREPRPAFDPTLDKNLDEGAGGYSFELANGVLGSHIFEGAGGTFTSVHRHGPAAHVLWLKGEGYSILWPDGGEDNKIKEDWGPGTLIVPPNWWWHGHNITSREPGRHVALKVSSRKNMVSRTHELTTVSRSLHPDGQSMSYADLPKETMLELKKIFLDEIA